MVVAVFILFFFPFFLLFILIFNDYLVFRKAKMNFGSKPFFVKKYFSGEKINLFFIPLILRVYSIKRLLVDMGKETNGDQRAKA